MFECSWNNVKNLHIEAFASINRGEYLYSKLLTFLKLFGKDKKKKILKSKDIMLFIMMFDNDFMVNYIFIIVNDCDYRLWYKFIYGCCLSFIYSMMIYLSIKLSQSIICITFELIKLYFNSLDDICDRYNSENDGKYQINRNMYCVTIDCI